MLDMGKYELSKYRMEKSQEDLLSAKELFKINMLKQSINRSYYSIFHSVRALLALDGVDFKKHFGVISFFLEKLCEVGEV